MKWTAYLDASVFWLLVIVVLTGFKDKQKIVYEDGVLMEKITSQNYSPVADHLLQNGSVVGNDKIREVAVDQKMKTEGCPYLRCMDEAENDRPMESTYSGTLILLYY